MDTTRTASPPRGLRAGVQATLFDAADAGLGLGDLDAAVRRVEADHGAWFEHLPGWVAGSDLLFTRLLDCVDWRAERRRMYDRTVQVPRLVRHYAEHDALPDPFLLRAREALDTRYGPRSGEPLCTVGLCLYRDGRDSVAWHGDRIGRGRTEDTIVAIVSLGAPRGFLLRPRGGGPTSRHHLGHGDLFVMGGSAQRTYEHCVPKTARAGGPRISVQFRPRGVR